MVVEIGPIDQPHLLRLVLVTFVKHVFEALDVVERTHPVSFFPRQVGALDGDVDGDVVGENVGDTVGSEVVGLTVGESNVKQERGFTTKWRM